MFLDRHQYSVQYFGFQHWQMFSGLVAAMLIDPSISLYGAGAIINVPSDIY